MWKTKAIVKQVERERRSERIRRHRRMVDHVRLPGMCWRRAVTYPPEV